MERLLLQNQCFFNMFEENTVKTKKRKRRNFNEETKTKKRKRRNENEETKPTKRKRRNENQNEHEETKTNIN